MGQFNTIPPNPFPPSSEKVGDAVEIEKEIASLENDLSEIKSGLTPEERFITANLEVIEDNNRFVIYKVGRNVFVTISYAPKSGAIVSDAVIASQFPIPTQAWQLFDGVTQLILDTNGSLKYYYPLDTTTLTRRDFTFSYVSAN